MGSCWIVVAVERGGNAAVRVLSVAASSEDEAVRRALKHWAAQGTRIGRVAALNLAQIHDSVEALLSEPPMIA